MSTVCQYWLQGNCRFGNSCWNKHETGPNLKPAGGPGAKKAVDWRQMTDEDILKGISNEVNIWETSNMWPLSVFSFANGAPILPGLTNFSFEEIRWEAYQAKASNTLNDYTSKLANIINEARQQKLILKAPDTNFRMKLLEFIHQAKGLVVSRATTGNSQNANIFQSSAFGQNPLSQASGISTFGQPQNSQQSQSFGAPTQGVATTPSQFVFNGASNQPSNSNQFFQQPTTVNQPTQNQTPTSAPIFGQLPVQASQVQTPIFGQQPVQPSATNTTPLFGQQNAQPQAVTSLFNPTPPAQPPQQQKLLFGKQVDSSVTAVNTDVDSSVYSTQHELSATELEAFKADQFSTLDSIPLCPPPRELCI